MVRRTPQRLRFVSQTGRFELRRRLAKRRPGRLRPSRGTQRLHVRRRLERRPTIRLWRNVDRGHVRLRRHVGCQRSTGIRPRTCGPMAANTWANGATISATVREFCDRRTARRTTVIGKTTAPVGPGTRVSAEGITITGTWDGDFVASGTSGCRARDEYSGKLYDPNGKQRRPGVSAVAGTYRESGQSRRRIAARSGVPVLRTSPAPDRDKAMLWYGRAADAGVAEAQYQLSELMFEESATRQRGLELLNRRGRVRATRQPTCGSACFFNSAPTSKKITRARSVSTKSAIAKGDVTARNNLAWLLATSPTAEAARRQTRGHARATACRAVRQLGLSRHARRSPGRGRRFRRRIAHRTEGACAGTTRREPRSVAGSASSRLTLFQRDNPTANPNGAPCDHTSKRRSMAVHADRTQHRNRRGRRRVSDPRRWHASARRGRRRNRCERRPRSRERCAGGVRRDENDDLRRSAVADDRPPTSSSNVCAPTGCRRVSIIST